MAQGGESRGWGGVMRETLEGSMAGLSAERILEKTGFKLAITFPDFPERVSPEIHEQREQLSSQFGENNVTASFYTNEDRHLCYGLFVREPQPDIPFS